MITKHSWLSPKARVKTSKTHGTGVFAIEHIRKDERIAIFGGDVMLIDEIKNFPKNIEEYTLQIEERFVLGLRNESDIEDSDFLNHSCNPNSGFKGQIFLVAMRDIKKHEEITFDYAMVVSKSVGSNIVFECISNRNIIFCSRLSKVQTKKSSLAGDDGT